MHNNFQYIIIGAGSAGLQLASALLQAPHNLVSSILLLDKSPEHENKTWCFWDGIEHKYTHLVKKTWGSIAFNAVGLKKSEDTRPIFYQYMESKDFYDFHIESFRADSRITIKFTGVDLVYWDEEKCFVSLKDGIVSCDYLFCTDAALLNTKVSNTEIILQSFLGWYVKFSEPVFDTDCATMMDFDYSCHGETNFMYVLPFSPFEALIESTFFAKFINDESIYQTLITSYINNKYGKKFELIKEERGVIPMCLPRKNNLASKKVIPIGSAAGCIKASTGYSFIRNRKFADCIYKQVLQGKQLSAPKWKKRFLFYDGLFISILKRQPGVMQNILVQLYKRNKISSVLKFLDEETNLVEEMMIFFSLPKYPFIKALFTK